MQQKVILKGYELSHINKWPSEEFWQEKHHFGYLRS